MTAVTYCVTAVWVECGALACAKAHVTAGKALVKHFRLALRSPQQTHFVSVSRGPRYQWFLSHKGTIVSRRDTLQQNTNQQP